MGISLPASAGSASNTAAASVDPPPSPPPIGIFLVSRKRILADNRIASSTACAARTTKLLAISTEESRSIAVLRDRVNSTSSVSASDIV